MTAPQPNLPPLTDEQVQRVAALLSPYVRPDGTVIGRAR